MQKQKKVNNMKISLTKLSNRSSEEPRSNQFLSNLKQLSLKKMLIFALVFGAIGAFFIFRSFAATSPVATLQAETMTLPSGGTNQGTYISMTTRGAATGTSPALSGPATYLSVMTRATACTGTVQMIVKVKPSPSDASYTEVQRVNVTNSSWAETPQVDLSKLPTSLSLPGGSTPTVSIEMNNDPHTDTAGKSNNIKCQRKLEVDKITFYKYTADPIPAPILTLTAAPTSVTAGQTSTLTWSTTNATSCNADGAWAGTKLISGSENTAPINAISTYTLTCTGPGGSANKVVTVGIDTPPTTSNSIYWGALIEGVKTYTTLYPGQRPGGAFSSQYYWANPPWDQETWNKFENNTGKKVSILHYGQPAPWVGVGSTNFYGDVAKKVTNRGAIPLISMSTTLADGETATPYADIINGKYDTQIRTWAQNVKNTTNWGKPFFLRLNWEMNGNWWDYNRKARENPKAFVDMWRHFHNVATSAGATNISWVWCPNILFSDTTPTGGSYMQELYPGNDYVDWTCLDGYNYPHKALGNSSFTQIFKDSYDKVNNLSLPRDSNGNLIAGGKPKPMMIAETGSSEEVDEPDPLKTPCVGSGPAKPNWITNTLKTDLPINFPNIKALVWFNWCEPQSSHQNADTWAIESSPESQAAFKAGIASPYYIPGDVTKYGNLPALSKVPIP